MDTECGGTSAPARADLLEGRGARCGEESDRFRLGLGLARLALIWFATAASPQTPLDHRQCYEHILTEARRPELSGGELDEELAGLVDALPDALSSGSNRDAEITRLACRLLLAVRWIEDPELTGAYAAVSPPYSRSMTVWQVANARLEAGHPADAEILARFGVESHGREIASPAVEPALWHVRAEAARILGRWGAVEECLGGMETSLARLEAGIARESGSQSAEATASLQAKTHEYRSRLLQARAHVFLELGLLDLCRGMAAQALEEATRSREPNALAAARQLAYEGALASGGDSKEAARMARDAGADPLLQGFRPVFRALEGLAEFEHARFELERNGDARASESRAGEALEEALESGLPPVEQLKVELALGDLGRIQGERERARTHLGRARAITETLGSSGPPDQCVQLSVLAWRLAHEGEVEPRDLDKARTDLFQAYERFLAEWRSTPRRPGGIGFLHLGWRVQLVSEVLEAELSAAPGSAGVERAFARLLEVQAMGTHAREHGQAPVELADVRSALLADGHGMLVLLLAADRSHLFVLDSKELWHRRLSTGRSVLSEMAEEITSELHDANGVVHRDRLDELRRALLPADVQKRIEGWSGAITVGFDLLRGLPFGILEDAEDRPYAERLALATLPSVGYGVELAKRPRSASAKGKDLVLVVANDPPPGLPGFEFSAAERKRLLAPFPDAAELLQGEQASRDGLLARAELLGDAAIVHFLAHGASVPDLESSSALVLSSASAEGQRFFTAEDVARLRLRGVVILSACGAGGGPARVGDDRLVHLGGAFLDAGARCVLLARFPVEYGATLALMEHVHAGLARGESVAEALRAARVEVRSGDGLQDYHATAFEVLGLGFEPAFERK